MPNALKKNRHYFVDKGTEAQEKWAVFGHTVGLKPRADTGSCILNNGAYIPTVLLGKSVTMPLSLERLTSHFQEGNLFNNSLFRVSAVSEQQPRTRQHA